MGYISPNTDIADGEYLDMVRAKNNNIGWRPDKKPADRGKMVKAYRADCEFWEELNKEQM